MRKTLSLTLALLIGLSLSACKKNTENLSSDEIVILTETVVKEDNSSVAKPNSENNNADSSTAETEDKVIIIDKTVSSNSSKKDTQSTSVQTEDAPYIDLVCRSIMNEEWHLVKFKNTVTNITLRTNLPNDWNFTKIKDNTFKITRSGKEIGTFTTGSIEKPIQSYEVQSRKISDITVKKQINRYKKGGKDVFYWYYEFKVTESGKTFSAKLRVNYAELNESAADTILYNSLKAPKENNFTPISKSNGSKQILILGNSFINSSQIGDFLNDMFYTSGEGYTVNAVSRGMAEVQHYAADTEMCNAIKSGQYSYVFLCGLYSDEAVNAVSTVKAACKASNTVLVIFPAHNESSEKIDAARTYNGDLYVLDWKGEIDTLISRGVDRYDFCVADTHNHSTPLAGYVGANMIYRSLFKKAPPALTASAPLTSAEVNSKLTDYINSGGDLNRLLRNYFEIK